MFKVQFDIKHKGCWGPEISEKYPDLRFASMDVRWVRGEVAHILVADLLKIEGNEKYFKEIIAFLKKRKWVTKVEVISKGKSKIYIRTLTQHNKQHEQFSNLFFDNDMFMTAPVKFEKGYEKWFLATADKKNITKVFNILKKKHETKLVYLKEETLGENLTAKQREILTFAKHFGYYEWPRKKGATEIAKLLGIPKTVFLSHLRKAENKVMNGFFE